VQIRVFRWRQAGGRDVLEPTTDVVASPPATTLPPGADYLVRVVRTAERPPAQEESYRLLVDELPDRSQRRAGTVAFVLRYSIPLFFGPATGASALSWRVARTPAGYAVEARNAGTRRVRIADLGLRDPRGRSVAARGLLGYVLAGSTMRWRLAGRRDGPAGPHVAITAQDAGGTIRATAPHATPR
jgi:fimbrial chaperone protein